jgi:mitogen-activated protein kinase 15
VLLGSTSYSTPADIWSFGCIVYEIILQKPMFPGETTCDQIHKILSYSGYPTEDEIKSLESGVVKEMLKESKLLNYSSNKEQVLKEVPGLFLELIKRMTCFNPKERITIEEILSSEVVQPFRKREEEVECGKVIMTEINDNKKLSVDEYRYLIYGIKRSYSANMIENRKEQNAKKSSSYSRLNVGNEYNEC